MVVQQGLVLVTFGVGAGLLASLAATKLMQTLLFGVGARDLTTFAVAPLLFFAVGLLASYLPARRATDVEPIEALKGS